MGLQEIANRKIEAALLVPNGLEKMLEEAEKVVKAYAATRPPIRNLRLSLELFGSPDEVTTLSTEMLLERVINAVTSASKLIKDSRGIFIKLMVPIVRIILQAKHQKMATVRQMAIKCAFQISDKEAVEDKIIYFKIILDGIFHDFYYFGRKKWPDCRMVINFFTESCQVLRDDFAPFLSHALQYTMTTALLVNSELCCFFRNDNNTSYNYVEEITAAIKSVQTFATFLPTEFSSYANEIASRISNQPLILSPENVRYSSIQCLATIMTQVRQSIPLACVTASDGLNKLYTRWNNIGGKLYILAFKAMFLEFVEDGDCQTQWLASCFTNLCSHFKQFMKEADAKHFAENGRINVWTSEIPQDYLIVIKELKSSLCYLFKVFGVRMLPHVGLLYPVTEMLLGSKRLPIEILFSLEVYASMIQHCGNRSRHLLKTSAAITGDYSDSTVEEVKYAAALLLCKYFWDDNFRQH